MRFSILFFIALIHFFGRSQNDSINRVDENGRKQGYWIYYGKDRPQAGYPEDGIVEEGTYLNNRKEGVWKKYHADSKTLKFEAEYHNNRLNGHYTKYFQDGTVKEQGVFGRSRNHNYRRFLEDGRLHATSKGLSNGTRIDSLFLYFDSKCLDRILIHTNPGGKQKTIHYSQERCNEIDSISHYEKPSYGVTNPNPPRKPEVRPLPSPNYIYILQSAEDGRITGRERYPAAVEQFEIKGSDTTHIKSYKVVSKGKSAKLDGYNKVYNENDEIFLDGEFNKGLFRHGKLYRYDKDGILLKIEIFKNGTYYGDGVL